MLEVTSESGAGEQPALENLAFCDVAAGLTCGVNLCGEAAARLKRQGPLPTVEGDRRRFVRFACRARGVLRRQSTFPAIPPDTAYYLVLVMDVSRSGVGFLHELQLLPRERCELWIEGGRRHTIEIVRCRRLQDRCYEVGGRFA
jgi:hypothetical protein